MATDLGSKTEITAQRTTRLALRVSLPAVSYSAELHAATFILMLNPFEEVRYKRAFTCSNFV